MSITENKHQRGNIYKLILNQTNDIYYGSTIEDKLTTDYLDIHNIIKNG